MDISVINIEDQEIRGELIAVGELETGAVIVRQDSYKEDK